MIPNKIDEAFKKAEFKIIQNQFDDLKKIKSKNQGGGVCKFWLENRCKKGETCEYHHQIITNKLPECPSYQSTGFCQKGKDCKYKHSEKQIKECPYYLSGYCKDGEKLCKFQHIKREICMNYTLGFCPEGPSCKFYHYKSIILPNHDKMFYLLKNKPINQDETYSAYIDSLNEVVNERKLLYPPQPLFSMPMTMPPSM
jgi:hypothetical protein